MSSSISFDRASEFYDATRGFPPGVGEQVAAAVARLVEPGSLVLEVGIGTGRVAIPLLYSGYRMMGIDLSWNMLQKLKENYQSQRLQAHPQPIRLAQADATRLPFPSTHFEAVLAVHVLHLIPEWHAALQEIHRVLKPGGSLLMGHTWRAGEAPRQALRSKHAEILQSYGFPDRRFVSRELVETGQALKAMGAQETETIAAEWTISSSPAQDLEHLQQRIWSSTWDIPDEVYARSLQDLDAWAKEQYGALDRPYSYAQRFIWRQYRW